MPINIEDSVGTLASVCTTVNHSYGLMCEEERREIEDQVSSIHCHHIQPLVTEIRKLRMLLLAHQQTIDNLANVVSMHE